MHIFLCPHPAMVKLKEDSFTSILKWPAEVHTDPLLLDIISAFWYGRDMEWDSDFPQSFQFIYQTLQEIGVHQMWTGILPIHLIEAQQQY